MSVEGHAGWILSAIAIAEGTWCAANVIVGGWHRFADYLGFIRSGAGVAGWTSAIVIAAIFVGYSAQLPSVRANLVSPSPLKLLGLAVAVTAGICEEAVFRRFLMNTLDRHGSGVAIQILSSGLLFGLAHAVWGAIRGSAIAALAAMIATGLLGAALAGVFILGNRVLAPCVVAHFIINALVEPGLVLAAVRGEFATLRTSAS